MESNLKEKNKKRIKRAFRIRKKLRGNIEKPRLSVYKSNKNMFAQLINDETGVTLYGVGSLSKSLKSNVSNKSRKDIAKLIGDSISEFIKKSEIKRVVFDRGRLKYHGLIAVFADAVRESGVHF